MVVMVGGGGWKKVLPRKMVVLALSPAKAVFARTQNSRGTPIPREFCIRRDDSIRGGCGGSQAASAGSGCGFVEEERRSCCSMEVVVFAAVTVSESLGKPLTLTSRSRTFENNS